MKITARPVNERRDSYIRVIIGAWHLILTREESESLHAALEDALNYK